MYCSRRCLGLAQRARAEADLNLAAFASWIPEMAYALGLFFADGSLSQQKGSWSVRFYNSDLATIEWWHAYIRNPHPLYERRPGKVFQIGSGKVYAQKRINWCSQVSSATLGAQLVALGGCPRKSFEVIDILDVPLGVQLHFLRGFFDGDGSVTIHVDKRGNPRLDISLTCNSEPFRAGLIRLLAAQEIQAVQRRIAVRLTGSNAERFCRWIYSQSGPCMARKAAIWNQWQALREMRGGLICDKRRAA